VPRRRCRPVLAGEIVVRLGVVDDSGELYWRSVGMTASAP
jgi:hypothetical protein